MRLAEGRIYRLAAPAILLTLELTSACLAPSAGVDQAAGRAATSGGQSSSQTSGGQTSGDVTVGDAPDGGRGGGPQITCTPLAIAFGETLDHTLSTVPILCTNTGTALEGVNLLIEPPTIAPDVFTAQFDQTKDPYPLGGLAPGQSAQIDVSYAPTAATNDTGVLTIRSNGGDETLEIPVVGTGLDVPPCQFVMAPSALDFANVPVGGASAVLEVEIENIGSNVCLIQGISFPADCAGEFRIVSLSIAPDPVTGKITIPAPATGVASSLTVGVEFTPTAGGAASCQIGVGFAGETLQLSGTSETSCLVVTPASIDFGRVALADAGTIASARSFEVSTQCQGPTSLEAITVQSGPGDTVPQFSVGSGPALPVVISPGSPASYQVGCAPTTPGTHVAQLLVSDGILDTMLSLSCDVP